MINLIKADVYRMVHQKSLYITLGILIAFYFMVLCSDGFVSNMSFAHFSRDTDTIKDFLFYFPKSSVFVAGSMIYGALFMSETYTSKIAASIYPLQQRKWSILLAQWTVSLIIFIVFVLVLIVMTLISSSLWISNELGSFSVLHYLAYLIGQGLLFASMMACAGIINHAFRNTTLSVIFAAVLGSSMIFMLITMMIDSLQLDSELLRYTITYTMGNLPYTCSWDGYFQPMAICFSYMSGCFMISAYLLCKKDMV